MISRNVRNQQHIKRHRGSVDMAASRRAAQELPAAMQVLLACVALH
jgi:hypothetical protein